MSQFLQFFRFSKQGDELECSGRRVLPGQRMLEFLP
jgi:hypothetical protein